MQYINIVWRILHVKKNRVLIITQNFYPEIGSAGNRMKNIFQLLYQEDYEVSVIATDPTYPNKKIYYESRFWNDSSLNKDKNIHRIKVRNRKYSTRMFYRLLYYIEVALKMILFVLGDRKKYDVILVSSPPIFIGFVGLVAKYRYRAEMILDIRDLWPESLKGVKVFNHKWIHSLFGSFETLLYRKANYIVVNSKGFINHIENKLNNNRNDIRIHFIPNSIRIHEIEMKEEKNQSFKVIYTGNVGLAQDVDFLKELAVKLNEQEILLNIVGFGLRRIELEEFVKINDLQYVKVLTIMNREDCLKLNSEHDVGILTLNDSEVFDKVLPGKLIDYMASGLPVVAAVSGYSKTIIEEYETGYVSEARDVDEIIRHLIHLKNNPKVMREMRKNSLNVIKSEFLWEENIYLLIGIIEKAINKKIPIYHTIKSKVESNG